MANARRSVRVLAMALVFFAGGCSSGGDCKPQPTLGVVGAMPSELAPLLERATIDDTQVIDGRVFRTGTLGGVRVVLAMTGIGLVNATETTRLLLDHFTVDGMVFSGVAGSPHRIADVTVPLSWSQPGGPSFAADPVWLDLARQAAAPGVAVFDRCTHVPPADPSSDLVCMPFEPAIFVSGRGESSDPFAGERVVCKPGGDDVFGCDPAISASATAAAVGAHFAAEETVAADAEEVTVDMETAAVAGETAARGLRFIAFRAVSDGAEDPLGLPGFPAQFFVYYRLAARNAAIATEAFLEQLSAETDDVLCS
jgi:nucleoside phosphorylase